MKNSERRSQPRDGRTRSAKVPKPKPCDSRGVAGLPSEYRQLPRAHLEVFAGERGDGSLEVEAPRKGSKLGAHVRFQLPVEVPAEQRIIMTRDNRA